MKPDQIAALAAAGYTKQEIQAMDAKPVTLESLAAEVQKLASSVGAAQAAAIVDANSPKLPTAEEILAGVTAAKPIEGGAK